PDHRQVSFGGERPMVLYCSRLFPIPLLVSPAPGPRARAPGRALAFSSPPARVTLNPDGFRTGGDQGMTEPSATPQPPPTPAPTPDGPALPALANAILPLVRLLPPPPVGTILAPPEPHDAPRRGWFVLQLWAELRLATQMYFDPRYRISRVAQIAFPALLGLMVLNYFFFTQWFSVWVVSPIAERLLGIVLVVIGYRILQREMDRYRAVLDYLARFQHR
ncbi:MAG: hypothetical protein K2V38_19170, partial [Gemmataceae bacterium]|nr:hypothetical protein [Gemmataceae bacterium]